MKSCLRCGKVCSQETAECDCGYPFVPEVGPFRRDDSLTARPLAGLGDRLFAQIADAVVGAIPLTLGMFLWPDNTLYLWLAGFFFAGYYVFCDGLPGGQSLGKRMVDIAVVDEYGEPCGYFRSLVRNGLQVLGFWDWIWILGSKRRRAGDWVARTDVVTL